MRSIAQRVLQLTAEERELAREIEALTRRLAPQLLDQPGVGPHAAAQLVLSWSHPAASGSEAAFARLAGAAPIPASSGQTIRYRLDRIRRPQTQPRTAHDPRHPQAHTPRHDRLHRTTPAGRQDRREANRCLKRYLARNLYRLLEQRADRDLTDIEASLAQANKAGPQHAAPLVASRRNPTPEAPGDTQGFRFSQSAAVKNFDPREHLESGIAVATTAPHSSPSSPPARPRSSPSSPLTMPRKKSPSS